MADAFILLLVILLPFIRTPLRITSPFGYICGFIGFTFIGKFFYNQWLGVPFLEQADPGELATHFGAMSAYLAVAFALALPFCKPRHRVAKRARLREQQSGFTLTAPALFLLIALPILLVVLGLTFGVNPLSNPLGFRQLIQSQGMFYVLSIFIFLLGAISIYVPYVAFVHRRAPSLMVVVAYLVSAGFAVISGFASMIISMVTVPLFFWSVCYRKRIELGLIVLLPVVVAFTLMYSAYRDANLAGMGLSLSDAIHRVTENPAAAANALNRFDYLENYAKAHRYLAAQDPDWGASLVGVLVQPIPRFVWPEKSENFSTSMTRELLPQNLEIGVTANFNSLNEFLRAFGSFGIIIGGMTLAIILAVSYCVFDAATDKPYLATYYVIVLFNYVQTGFFAGFVNDLALPSFVLNNIFFQLFIRRFTSEPRSLGSQTSIVPSEC